MILKDVMYEINSLPVFEMELFGRFFAIKCKGRLRLVIKEKHLKGENIFLR